MFVLYYLLLSFIGVFVLERFAVDGCRIEEFFFNVIDVRRVINLLK